MTPSCKFHYSQFNQETIKPRLNRNACLRATRHAQEAAKNDRYGCARLPRKLPTQFRVDELEQKEGRDSKYVVRYKVGANVAQTIVLVPTDDNNYIIVTTWLNDINDNHSSLKNSNYSPIEQLV